MAGRVAGKIKLQSVDELLGVPEIAGTQEIELERIHSFPNHPFKVIDDEFVNVVDYKDKNAVKTALKKIDELKSANLDFLDSHSIDAIAVGYYQLGKLRSEREKWVKEEKTY